MSHTTRRCLFPRFQINMTFGSSPSSFTFLGDLIVRYPVIKTALPGPQATRLIEVDRQFVSPSYTRIFPLVAQAAEGLWITDPDGNVFLDFTSGIAVCATGHCHPRVVDAIREQAGRLLHMSGTDFYYTPRFSWRKSLLPSGLSAVRRKSSSATPALRR